jgi:hypothetical protein
MARGVVVPVRVDVFDLRRGHSLEDPTLILPLEDISFSSIRFAAYCHASRNPSKNQDFVCQFDIRTPISIPPPQRRVPTPLAFGHFQSDHHLGPSVGSRSLPGVHRMFGEFSMRAVRVVLCGLVSVTLMIAGLTPPAMAAAVGNQPASAPPQSLPSRAATSLPVVKAPASVLPAGFGASAMLAPALAPRGRPAPALVAASGKRQRQAGKRQRPWPRRGETDGGALVPAPR